MEEAPSDSSFLLNQKDVHVFRGFLLDVDGTIIDTTSAIIKHWKKIGTDLGVDHEVILRDSRGRRSIDTLALYDPSLANWEYVNHIEGLIPNRYGAEVREIPGARRLLEALGEERAPWALVTSCTRNLLDGWLRLLELPTPPTSVAAEDVMAGKPDPACYSLARERCGLGEQPGVLVIEDAPAGIRAGKAAGCSVLALATTHDVERLRDAGADWIVKDLDSIRVLGKKDDGWRIFLDKEWQSAA